MEENTMIDSNTTFDEILKTPRFAPFQDFLLSNCRIPDLGLSLKAMQEVCYDWVADSIAYGLNRVIALLDSGEKVAYDFYTDAEMEACPEKKGTKLFFMPAKRGAPFVMVCPGGGYGAVCTLKEGFTTGARLNELGYNVFVLSYRVQPLDGKSRLGILPKPLDDMASAFRFIAAHAGEFGVCMERYAVAGFSSGGHLAAEWGTENCGAVSYGLPKPEAIFLGYPASDTTLYGSINGKNLLLIGMLGENYTEEEINRYNVNANITDTYPTVYIWHCKDDNIISIETSYKMVRELEKHGIPHRFKEVEHGGHGFGLGEFSEAKGWLEEAVELWKNSRR